MKIRKTFKNEQFSLDVIKKSERPYTQRRANSILTSMYKILRTPSAHGLGYAIPESELYLTPEAKASVAKHPAPARPMLPGQEDHRWPLILISWAIKHNQWNYNVNPWDVLWARYKFWDDEMVERLRPLLQAVSPTEQQEQQRRRAAPEPELRYSDKEKIEQKINYMLQDIEKNMLEIPEEEEAEE